MKRIFCTDCKYHKYYDPEDRGFWHYCMHKNSKIVNRNSIDEWVSHKDCFERNHTNNCHDYKKKETLWNTVLAFFH